MSVAGAADFHQMPGLYQLHPEVLVVHILRAGNVSSHTRLYPAACGGGAGPPVMPITILSAWVAACGEVAESFTIRLKKLVPAVVGVPLMMPEADSVKAAGSEPDASVQE